MKIRELLKGKARGAELREALAELTNREKQIRSRLDDVAENCQFSGQPGAARKVVMLEGSPSDLVALDDECRHLAAELSAIPQRAEALRAKLAAVELDDYERTLPATIKTLVAAAEKRTKVASALAEADAALKEASTEVLVGRRALKQAKRKAPPVPMETVAALASAQGLQEPEGRAMTYSSAIASLYDALADCESPGKRSAEQTARRMSKTEAAKRQGEASRRESTFWNGGGKAA